jgi:hypothetical protein
MSDIQGVDTTPPSRRSLVKGAAWAVPAVVVAAAAPTVAASVPCLTATFGATSCKQPGNGNNYGYRLSICFTNNCTTSITITVTQVASNTGNPVIQPVNQTITVAAGDTVCLPQFVLYCSRNSANFINVYYTIQGQTGTQVATVPSPERTCRADDQFCN